MKTIAFIIPLVILIFSGCSDNSNDNRVTMLEQKLDSAYRPGFAEFMTNIQIHHAKLWFAGQNENWQLADFELKEIEENIENLKKFRPERKETQMVIMINPQLDSVNMSIRQKSPALFKTSFTSLTNKCNTCHKLVNYGFNRVKIPDTLPFSNQEFGIEK